jgi:hypothetical protein
VVHLKAFYGFNNLTEVFKKKNYNGAGAAGDWRSKLIPNTLYFLNCRIVFVIHDHAYDVGRSFADKEQADEWMLINLLRKIKNDNSFIGRLLKPARHRRALKYYETVQYLGKDPFWAGNKEAGTDYQAGRRPDLVKIT